MEKFFIMQAIFYIKMIEKVDHIKNPLTIIAIFAALVEIGSIFVLPFLSTPIQSIYLYFLMGFPILLVILFFVVLIFKTWVLYGPSDFQDDSTFASFYSPPIPRIIEKLKAEVIEEQSPSQEPPSTFIPPKDSTAGATTASIVGTYRVVEDLVIDYLNTELKMPFKRNVIFKFAPNLQFDAFFETGNEFILVEVKYAKSIIRPEIIRKVIIRSREFFNKLPIKLNQCSLIFCIAFEDSSNQNFELLNSLKKDPNELERFMHIPMNFQVHFKFFEFNSKNVSIREIEYLTKENREGSLQF